MELLEAIHTRQSIPKVKPDPVPKELIETLLSAAVQAPNHHRVRPWRFVVLQGVARERLGDIMAQSLQKRQPEVIQEVLVGERLKPLRAPLVIAVGVDHPSDSKAIEIENVCAAAAAIQNLLLAAHGLGLGGFWRTGPAAYDPDIKVFLGFSADQHLIGFLYIGFPETVFAQPQRPSYDDRTTWIN